MDEEGIAVVLGRASELRSKLNTCIHTRDEDGDEDEERLLSIRDAMDSLEAQLTSLQALQQHQWYEREAALAEIDDSREKLLKQLKDYKGEDLEVIHEASAFASETVEENNDLLLSPYPTRPSRALLADNNGYQSTRKGPDGALNEENQLQYQKPRRGLRFLVSAAAKTVITLVGVVSILGLAGFEPRLRKRGNEFKAFTLFRPGGNVGERDKDPCPPGKVLVIKDGEARCLVKERFEVPFHPIVATPDIKYGCG